MTTTNQPTVKMGATGTGQTAQSASRSWWWISGLLLLAIPWIYWTSANAEPEAFAARRQRIENMSAIERERLEGNFERFQKLSLAKQTALRLVDESVNNDEELKSTALTYDRWLKTLTPWQRQELRKASDADARFQVVTTINDERKIRQEEYAQRKKEYEQEEKDFQDLLKKNLTYYQGRKPEGVRLSDAELALMMSVLNDEFGAQVELRPNALPGNAAYNLQLLALALRANLENQGLETAEKSPLSDETIERMLDAIADTDVHDHMRKNIYAERESRRFVGFLIWKLQTAWWHEARRQYPKQSELDEIAKNLGGRALEDFKRQKEREPHRAYFRLWGAKNYAVLKMDSKKLDEVLSELGMGHSNLRPSGSGGPNGNRRGGGGRGPGSGPRDKNGFPPRPGRGPMPPRTPESSTNQDKDN